MVFISDCQNQACHIFYPEFGRFFVFAEIILDINFLTHVLMEFFTSFMLWFRWVNFLFHSQFLIIPCKKLLFFSSTRFNATVCRESAILTDFLGWLELRCFKYSFWKLGFILCSKSQIIFYLLTFNLDLL